MLLGLVQGDKEHVSLLILQVYNTLPAALCRLPGQGVVAKRCKSLGPGVDGVEFESILETEVERSWKKLEVCLVILQEITDLMPDFIMPEDLREDIPDVRTLATLGLIVERVVEERKHALFAVR
ncbi:hypothetical protein DSECCO2_518470 [anaerobic digester metagenome]